METLCDWRILRLKAHHSQAHFDQGGAHSRVAVFGHLAWHPFVTAAVFAGTKAGVTADRAPVLERIPVADLAADHHRGELAHAAGMCVGAAASSCAVSAATRS